MRSFDAAANVSLDLAAFPRRLPDRWIPNNHAHVIPVVAIDPLRVVGRQNPALGKYEPRASQHGSWDDVKTKGGGSRDLQEVTPFHSS